MRINDIIRKKLIKKNSKIDLLFVMLFTCKISAMQWTCAVPMHVQYRIPCVKKAIVNCTLENVLIYFRIRAQIAYILI